MRKTSIMKKSNLIALMLLAVWAHLFSLPVSGKEVELNCKTQKGKNVIYLINNNPPSVKDTDDGSDYQVLLFSPTKLVFKKEININLGVKYFNSEFTYTIDRTNLNYQVNQKNYTNADNLPKTGAGGDNYTGKCSIVPRKPVAF